MTAAPEHINGTPAIEIIGTPDGEVLDLNAPSDMLAAAVVDLQRSEAQFKAWRELALAELFERMEEHHRKRASVGEYELQVTEPSKRRVWDVDALEIACRELCDAGTLRAAEVAGLLNQQPPKVDGNLAQSLLSRVAGPARAALEDCFRWELGRPKLTVTRSIPLLPAESPHKAPRGAQEGTR